MSNGTNQAPLRKATLNQVGSGSGSRIKGNAASTSDALYVPWKNGSLYENGYISKFTHSGELQWRKQIADVNQITTATDVDENLYTAWSRNSYHTEETRGSFIAKLNPDNGEIIWKTELESHNYIINDLHSVGDMLYAVGQYKGTARPLLIAVNRNDGSLSWQKEIAASDSSTFTEIDSDGSNLYISSKSALGISGTVHQFKLDGSAVKQWQGSDRQKLIRTNTQDQTSVIIGDQIISAGKTSLDEFYDGTSWRLVSRNLETGKINWRQQWGNSGYKTISSIVEFKGKIYAVAQEKKGNGWQGNVQEVSPQGELGRQIYFEAPTNAEQDAQLVSNGDQLFLINTATQEGDVEAGVVQIVTGEEASGAISAQQNASNQAPTLQLSGDASITIQQGSEWVEEGWSASDPEDGDLSTNVSVTSPSAIDTSKPGTYELTYSVEDSEG